MVRYGKTLTGSPSLSVWVDGSLAGFTDRIGVIQYDETAKKLLEERPVEPLLIGYRETCPTHFPHEFRAKKSQK